MDAIRSRAFTGLATALALAASLPAAAQVATSRPLMIARPPTAAMLAPARPEPTPISPEQRALQDQTERKPADAADRLSPSLRAWVKSRARALVDSGAEPDPNQIASDVRTRLGGQDYGDADIEAIAFIVMMEASKAAKEDLRDIMEQTKAANERKAQQRKAQQATVACVKAPCLYQAPKDSMSEMGEMESLRLQMAMDRLSKLMSTLSNLLKKSSDTAASITQNLK